MKIKWHLDQPEGIKPFPRVFNLDETKSWKGAMIRGYDVAEMIAQEFWEIEAIALRKVIIDGPAAYAGNYDIVPKFEPTFVAKRIEENVPA